MSWKFNRGHPFNITGWPRFFYSGPTTYSCPPLNWQQRFSLDGFRSGRCCPPLNWLQRFNLNGFPTRRCCPPFRMLSVNIPNINAYVHLSYPSLVDTLTNPSAEVTAIWIIRAESSSTSHSPVYIKPTRSSNRNSHFTSQCRNTKEISLYILKSI